MVLYKNYMQMKQKSLLVIFLVLFFACNPSKRGTSVEAESENWIQLFNSKDIKDWEVKIAGYPVGENFGNTFVVEDGLLKVNYSAYGDDFKSRFGHLFTKNEYSHYKLRVEYRFFGKHLGNAPQWSYLNNGVMLHSQAPETMHIDQSFPASVEAQLLGSDSTAVRPTGNVCTPGTDIFLNGELYTDHCANSSSKPYNWDEWVNVELVVLGDSIVYHIVEGDTVIVYTHLTVDGKGLNTETNVTPGALKSGRIAIQSEGHPTAFRKIELLDLSSKYK
jgi:hypothetical protein